MGYIGLYEAATMFYGPDWESNQAKTFTLDILRDETLSERMDREI